MRVHENGSISPTEKSVFINCTLFINNSTKQLTNFTMRFTGRMVTVFNGNEIFTETDEHATLSFDTQI